MNAIMQNNGNRDFSVQIEPELNTFDLIPEHLNYSFSMIYKLFIEDVTSFILENKLENDSEFITKVLTDPKNTLGAKKYRRLFLYKGKLRKYSEQVRDAILTSINTRNQSIFLSKYDSALLRDKLYELNYFDVSKIVSPIDSTIINSKNRFTTAINAFFQEIYDVKIQGRKFSILDQIYLSNQFYSIIFRIVALNKFKLKEIKPNDLINNWLLKYFVISNGNQIAWNFPVTVAKWIYSTVLTKFPEDEILYVGDTSLGWGGRLTGLLASINRKSTLNKKKIVLIGTDPNYLLTEKYHKLYTYWKRNINPYVNLDLKIRTVGAEDLFAEEIFREHKGKIHLVFSSPPYYNKEHYSYDEAQSFIKFPEFEDWLNHFLKPLIQNTFELLRPHGYFFLNISNISGKGGVLDLISPTLSFANEVGFKHIETYKMTMGIVQGAARKNKPTSIVNEIILNGKRYKYEPIFQFLKEK